MPNVNLISNIGFGVDATHTTGKNPFENIITKDIGVIIHPKNVKVNKKEDKYISRKVLNIRKKWICFRMPYRFKFFLRPKYKFR